jgi:hypothetical protein
MSGLRRWQIDPGCDAVGDARAQIQHLACLSLTATYGQAAWLRHSQSINHEEASRNYGHPRYEGVGQITRRRVWRRKADMLLRRAYPWFVKCPKNRRQKASRCGADIAFRPPSALAALYVRRRPSGSRADLTPARPIAQIFLRRTSPPTELLANHYLWPASRSISGHSPLKHSCRINFSSWPPLQKSG